MEFILFGLIILFLVGVSSNRTTRTPTQTFYTSSTNSTGTIEKNLRQPIKSDLNEAGGHTASTSWALQTPPAPPSKQLNVPDDRCNKCGKKWHQFENSETGQKFYGCSGWPNCKNSRQMQLLEKFCGNGHRRTESNNTFTASGARRCLICQPYAKDNLEDFCGSGHRRTESNFTYTASGARRCLICQPFAKDIENFCGNGHQRTHSNTAYTASGARRCLICQPFPENDLSNHCANGHPRTPSNTSLTWNGEVRCLNCRPLPKSPPQRSKQDLDKYCRNGHLRTPESTYTRPNGDRECSICRSNRRK